MSVFSQSIMAVAGELVELLRPYSAAILPLFFFGFFLAAFLAIMFSDRQNVRKSFVIGFFALTIVFNTVSPVALAPFVSWGHFSEPVPETVQSNEIRIVDEHGNELKFDDRAGLSFDAISVRFLADAMLTEYGEQRNEVVARHLIEEARLYRKEVEDPPVTHHFRFPHHGWTSTWTPDVLDGYGEFVGIRIYQMTLETSADGTEVQAYEEEVQLEVYPFETRPERGPIPNTSPPESINRTAPSGGGSR